MPDVLVLQHHPETGPAAFTEVLDDRRSIAPWRLIDLAAGQPLPDGLEEVAGIVTMGGLMSATRPDEHGWMRDELAFLRRAVEAEVPVLGVCLGAQLLGAALGGEVAPRKEPRATFAPLRRTAAGAADDVSAGWPDGAAALLLHEDEVVRFPTDAHPLLTGPDGQAIVWGAGSAVAVQAHPEVTPEHLSRWLALDQLTELVARAGVDPVALLDEAVRRERFSVPLGRALLGRWLDGPVRRALG